MENLATKQQKVGEGGGKEAPSLDFDCEILEAGREERIDFAEEGRAVLKLAFLCKTR